MPLNGCVRPVIPWADPDLLAELIDAINGAALVRASDDQLVLDERDNEFLTLSLEFVGVYQFFLGQLIDKRTLSVCSYHDRQVMSREHFVEVFFQIIYRDKHALEVLIVDLNIALLVGKTQGIWLFPEENELLSCRSIGSDESEHSCT